MSWGHEVCLVTWHMCPGSRDRGHTWAGNEVPDGENCWFHAVCLVLGRQRHDIVELYREEDQKWKSVVSLSRLSCLKMGDGYLLRA